MLLHYSYKLYDQTAKQLFFFHPACYIKMLICLYIVKIIVYLYSLSGDFTGRHNGVDIVENLLSLTAGFFSIYGVLLPTS